jgi:diguanylate cyclase (GGDEF)-like protein
MVAGFFSIEEVLPGPSASDIISGLALFILSFIWTAGFILMVSQRLQSSLSEMAMNDSLTQLHNRRAMDRMLDSEMARVHQEMANFSIILMDIDRFKEINDSYGHDVGDRVLQWFASTLQKNLRLQDVVARWGGEEFLILLPDTPVDEAVRIADRLRVLIASEQVDLASEAIHVTFSAGIASSTLNRDVRHLCQVADQALYEAKQTRNRVISLDEALAPA